MKKIINFALDLRNLKKTFGYNIFWQVIRNKLRLQIFDNPVNLSKPRNGKNKILVLSPHPDDDIFAIGGTLHKYAKNGDEVTVIYLCDGSKGTPQGIRDSSLIAKRRKETEDSAKIIGINDVVFWGYRDGQLAPSKTSTKALFNLINEIKPNIIFLPGLVDDHPDHIATSEIFYNTFINYKDEIYVPEVIAQYEVWTPQFPNRLIVITDVIETKKEAILCHKSQLRSRGYDKAILSLNKYRGELNGIKGYAEGLFVSDLKIYLELFEKLNK